MSDILLFPDHSPPPRKIPAKRPFRWHAWLALSSVKPAALSLPLLMAPYASFKLMGFRLSLPVLYLLSEVSQLSFSNLPDYKAAPLSGRLSVPFSLHNNVQTATSDKDWRRNKRLLAGSSESDPLPNMWPLEGVLKPCGPSKERQREKREVLQVYSIAGKLPFTWNEGGGSLILSSQAVSLQNVLYNALMCWKGMLGGVQNFHLFSDQNFITPSVLHGFLICWKCKEQSLLSCCLNGNYHAKEIIPDGICNIG